MEKTRNRSFTSAAEGGTSFTGVSVYWLMVFAIPPAAPRAAAWFPKLELPADYRPRGAADPNRAGVGL
jgi:hypothetical protein